MAANGHCCSMVHFHHFGGSLDLPAHQIALGSCNPRSLWESIPLRQNRPRAMDRHRLRHSGRSAADHTQPSHVYAFEDHCSSIGPGRLLVSLLDNPQGSCSRHDRTCIVSCVRYSKTFWAVEDPTCKPFTKPLMDFRADLILGDTVGLADWQLIEANVTILCVCLIASKPVANYLVPDGLVRLGSYISRSLRSHRSRAEANEEPPLKDRLSGLSHHRNEDGIELQQHPSSTRSEDMAHSCV